MQTNLCFPFQSKSWFYSSHFHLSFSFCLCMSGVCWFRVTLVFSVSFRPDVQSQARACLIRHSTQPLCRWKLFTKFNADAFPNRQNNVIQTNIMAVSLICMCFNEAHKLIIVSFDSTMTQDCCSEHQAFENEMILSCTFPECVLSCLCIYLCPCRCCILPSYNLTYSCSPNEGKVFLSCKIETTFMIVEFAVHLVSVPRKRVFWNPPLKRAKLCSGYFCMHLRCLRAEVGTFMRQTQTYVVWHTLTVPVWQEWSLGMRC